MDQATITAMMLIPAKSIIVMRTTLGRRILSVRLGVIELKGTAGWILG
jgi:hypothetical protein